MVRETHEITGMRHVPTQLFFEDLSVCCPHSKGNDRAYVSEKGFTDSFRKPCPILCGGNEAQAILPEFRKHVCKGRGAEAVELIDIEEKRLP